MSALQNQKMKKTKILAAIDFGEKYCGIAYSPNQVNVFPVAVVEIDAVESRLSVLIEDKGVTHLVLGLPYSTDGSENKLCAQVRQFARRLKRQFGLPIDFVDERYSSKSAVTDKSNNRLDDRAAAQILEYYLAQY